MLNEVVCVEDGAEAIDYLFGTGAYEGRDPDDPPALTLLDINLPKLSGLDVLQAYPRRPAHPPHAGRDPDLLGRRPRRLGRLRPRRQQLHPQAGRLHAVRRGDRAGRAVLAGAERAAEDELTLPGPGTRDPGLGRRASAVGVEVRPRLSRGRGYTAGMGIGTGVVLMLAMASSQPGGAPAPRTVESVDLRAYAGTYFEIARYPNRFQNKCVGDVTATYELRENGRVAVINRCRTGDGTLTEARGIVKRAGKDPSNAKLKVRFAPAILSFIPKVWGDYWILGIGPDYSYAVIGDPSRTYLWILSRTPLMSDLAWRQALEIAAANGYNVERLVKTPQRGSANLAQGPKPKA